MLNLTKPLVLNEEAILSANLCDRFEPEDLARIGIECSSGYERDEQSRSDWLRRNEAGMNLALQVQKDKSFPWPGCANVNFPLVTIAAQQFHARAYPALVDGTQVVKCAVFSEDPDGTLRARADRISTHMSWQRLYQDKSWEEQEDKAILNVAIVGTNFKKSYYASEGYGISELVLAKDLVLNYWAKSVEACPRKTHKIRFFRNEVYEKVRRELWRDILDEPWYNAMPAPTVNQSRAETDKRQGVTPPMPDAESSLQFCEQHCNLDLDEDGYAEPYIITFEEVSKQVVRIVTRFDGETAIERTQSKQIISIKAIEYFTKKTFIPSPDGGIYDIGFGVFLGPLNESVNSILNMLLDAGTVQTTSGGFLARGAKIRGGVSAFSPFEWRRVDSTGDDLRKSMVPMPTPQPSPVLFQLLGLLIDYSARVAGTTDITVGENPGQNTPAQTTQTMVEMGQKIYTAIFKRIWRAAKEEYTKLYHLNGRFLPSGIKFVGGATAEDYQGTGDDVFPVADPNVTSESMRMQQAIQLKMAASSTSGYNRDAVERRFLSALRVESPKEIFPGTEGAPPPKDPKVQIVEIQEQGETQRLQMQLQADQQEFAIELMEGRQLNNARIIELMARAEEAAANAQSEAAYAQVALINAQVAQVKAVNEKISKRIEQMLKAAETHAKIKALQKPKVAA